MERPPDESRAAVALDFFDRLYAAYERAEAAGGPVVRGFVVAGREVRLRLAGPALLPYLTPALAHLAAAPRSAPALTVCAWESESTGVSAPPPAWSWGEYGAEGEIRGFAGGRIEASYQQIPGIFSILDRTRSVAIYWVRSVRHIPRYEIAAPLRSIFQWWAAGMGVEQVHAAAVGLPEGGVLLPGNSGSGKSNTALACLASDLRLASDDFCLVSSGPRPTIHSQYSTAKAREADLDRLPFLRPWASSLRDPGSFKLLYFLHDHVPERLSTGFPLRAILVPRVTGALDTRLRPGTPALALAALAPSSIVLTPSRARDAFRGLAEIVRRVPCLVLEVGTDVGQIPDAIRRVLRADGALPVTASRRSAGLQEV